MAWIFFLISFFIYGTGLSLRHYWFQTSAWDLGIFNQAIYLISQGLPAQSSLLGFHVLGDHGAIVLYPLGWIAALFPSTNFLFFIQAGALASAVFPLERLARKNGLTRARTGISLLVVLLYPVVFNTAIFDFHPEVLAIPLVIEAVGILDDSKPQSNWRAILYLIFALTCKVSIAFLVIGIALWLLIKRKRKLFITLSGIGFAWLTIVGGILIPHFGGADAQLIRHADKFGFGQNANFESINLIQVISQINQQFFSIENLEYLFLLLIPIFYLIFHKNRKKLFLSFIPFSPLLLLNLAASELPLKNLVHHYSLFFVPFLAIAVQKTLAQGSEGVDGYPQLMRKQISTLILIWTTISFIIFSRITFFFGSFQDQLSTAHESREAIQLVNPKAAVLTSNNLIPHLSRRRIIDIATARKLDRLNDYDQILINQEYPGWNSSAEVIEKIKLRLNQSKNWSVIYSGKAITLFEQS